MRFLPAIIVLLALVMFMAGPGRFKVGEQIGLVILGFLILMGLFALAMSRAL